MEQQEGRELTTEERRSLSAAVCALVARDAERAREPLHPDDCVGTGTFTASMASPTASPTALPAGPATLSPILLCTAFSAGYPVGPMCAAGNRAYAAKHGYQFLCEVLPGEQMLQAIQPRTGLTWYKVLLVLRLLREAPER